MANSNWDLAFQIGIPLMVGAFFVFIILRIKKMGKNNKRRAAQGVSGTAQILGIENVSNNNSSGKAQVIQLNLMVTAENKAPYPAATQWIVESLHFSKIQEGRSVSIKVDALNKSIIYPDVSWAEYWKI